MAFGLKRDGATGKLFSLAFSMSSLGVSIGGVELWLVVLQHYFSIDDMADNFVSTDFDLSCYPYVTVIGIGIGARAMLGDELTTHDDVGSWRAKIGCRSRALSVPS